MRFFDYSKPSIKIEDLFYWKSPLGSIKLITTISRGGSVDKQGRPGVHLDIAQRV
jgi:hypothetical protein